MDPSDRRKLSLRARFVLGLGAMLLPLALLGAGALFSLRDTGGALHEVVEEAIGEIHPVVHLQVLALQAAMPPNDYLIHGDPAKREHFARLGWELDRAFEAALAGPFALAQERELIRSARQEWRQARSLAGALLALPRPVGNPAAARDMERMDAHVDRAVDLLQRVHDLAHREMEEALVRAAAVERRALFLLAAAFGLGLAIAAGAGVLLARSVLLPVRALKESASRLGAGELSHRAEAERMPDELAQVAAARSSP